MALESSENYGSKKRSKKGYFLLIFSPEEDMDDYICKDKTATFGRGNRSNSKTNVINIGESKCISREHAKVSFDKSSKCWKLKVLSKKGLWSRGEYYAQNDILSLSNTKPTPLKLGTSKFYFAPAQ